MNSENQKAPLRQEQPTILLGERITNVFLAGGLVSTGVGFFLSSLPIMSLASTLLVISSTSRFLSTSRKSRKIDIIGNSSDAFARIQQVKSPDLSDKAQDSIQAQCLQAICEHIKKDQNCLNLMRDLAGANLSDLPLKKVDLRNANLERVNFRGAELGYANLQHANLQHANFENADLRKANLSYVDLKDANLKKASLGSANLQHANLQNTHMEGADLNSVDFRGADLTNACLHDATLDSADLGNTNLDSIRFHQNMMWLNVVGLHKANGIPEKLQKSQKFVYGVELSKAIEDLIVHDNLTHFREVYTRVISKINDDAAAASLWNKMAWLSSLYGRPDATSLDAAEQAVALVPDKGNYRDTLGFILALQKKHDRAISELKIALESEDVKEWPPEFIRKRENWIEDLKSGGHSFFGAETEETIKILRSQER
jgi:uncharacterized protein YjbI with pentapeptide repeats